MVIGMTALERAIALSKKKLDAGEQINWNLAFATTRPTKTNILFWYEDAPKHMKKAELIEWLAEKALKEYGE